MKLAPLLLLLTLGCNAQNGPTPPSVVLAWTQSTAAGVTKNCVYRGAAAGTYAVPALFCSTAPVLTYTDLTVVRGTTYHYAVTAGLPAGAESSFSNDVVAAVPVLPAPTGANPKQITRRHRHHRGMALLATVIP